MKRRDWPSHGAIHALVGLTLGALLAGRISLAHAADPLPAITRESQREVLLAFYNGHLGLVKDVREVQRPAGLSEVQFVDVAAQIDPTTVHLKSLADPAGLKILEQNYEYDLLSSEKRMEKYVERKVRLYQGGGSYLEATLLSTKGPVCDINGSPSEPQDGGREGRRGRARARGLGGAARDPHSGKGGGPHPAFELPVPKDGATRPTSRLRLRF
jgi:hypothetical protein